MVDRFAARNSAWLDEAIVCVKEEVQKTCKGRPEKEFASCSKRTKRRKVQPLVVEYCAEELAVAAQVSFMSQGSKDVAEVIEGAVDSTPHTVKRMKTARLLNVKEHSTRCYTADEAQKFWSCYMFLELVCHVKVE